MKASVLHHSAFLMVQLSHLFITTRKLIALTICLGWEDPWRRKWQPTPISLLGKFHGQRSLMGCSPWGHLPTRWEDPGSIPGLGRYLGEGNGNPLQYFCLENSMDRGAWQAIVHGVAKRLTQLSN